MFARLGAMGVSVLFSSGDSGVGGGSCHLNDGKGSKKFIPAFPASCGCFFIDNITNTRDLLMVIARSLCHDSWWHNSSEPRGGGQLLRRRFFELLFSPVLSGRSRLFIPPEHLVASILASFSVFVCFDNGDLPLLTDIVLSATGRGYPDISAQAAHFQIVVAGEVMSVDGTSCSVPVHFPMNTI
jgi:tripeptidyl-peptidase-1